MTARATVAPSPGASVHLALVVVQLAFGSLAVEGKVALAPPHHVDPSALAMARILGGALVFVPLAILRRSEPSPPLRLGDAVRLVLLGAFGIVINQALFLAGLKRTTPIAATLLVALIPVFAAGVAALAGREPLRARTALGIGLALVGTATLAGFAAPAAGDVLVLLNSLSYAVYVVFAKDVLARVGTARLMAWVFGSGAALFAPFGGVALARDVAGWRGDTLLLVGYLVLVPTVLAYGINAWALRRATPTLVTVYVYLQPLVVAVLARVQLGHRIAPRVALAGVLILGGVAVVTRLDAALRRAGSTG